MNASGIILSPECLRAQELCSGERNVRNAATGSIRRVRLFFQFPETGGSG